MDIKKDYERPLVKIIEMELQGVVAVSGDGEVTNPNPGNWH